MISNAFRWNNAQCSSGEGDILIIDNRLVMHSRNPFKNDKSRRILAAIGGAPLYLEKKEKEVKVRTLSTLRSGDQAESCVWKVQKMRQQ